MIVRIFLPPAHNVRIIVYVTQFEIFDSQFLILVSVCIIKTYLTVFKINILDTISYVNNYFVVKF